ncbi:MAG: MATE family efflux transporter [Ferruginibacter sp.]|nr:MATE family efflux transporter [Cytophagales bacterium]
MGVVSNVMVGPLGAAALGAVGIANSIFFVVAILGIGTLSVVAPMVANANGAGDWYRCKQLFRDGVFIGLGTGTGLVLVIGLLANSFGVFRQTAEITVLAREYLLISGVSIVPLLVFVAAKQFGDGLSHTRIAMYITLAGLGVNVLSNWLLIHGHWGFPALGVRGSALSVLIARVGMAALILAYVSRAGVFKPYWRALPRPGQPKHLFSRIIRLGLPSGLQYFFEIAAFTVAIVVVGWLGKYPLAAHEIAISLASITYMMASGLAAAGSIRVGEATGRGNQAGVVRAGTVAFALTAFFMAGCCGLFLIATEPLVRLYIQDPRVTEIAVSLVVIAGFFQLSDGIQVVGLGVLRGIADVNIPTVITLFAYWIIGLPLGYLLAFRFGLNAPGIWIGLSVGLTVSAVLLTLRFYRLSAPARTRRPRPEKSLTG